MPILGTVASQFAGKPFNSFESMASFTVGSGGQDVVEFTLIPQTFKHLQLRFVLKNNDTGSFNNVPMRFNGATSDYFEHYLTSDTAINATGGANLGAFNTGFWAASTSLNANVFTTGVVEILDYSSTSKTKVIRSHGGGNNNTTGILWLHSGLFNSQDAISSIQIDTGGQIVSEHSQFALYGIKGA